MCKYDDDGCPIDPVCDTCQEEFDDAHEKYRFVLFLVSSIAGVIAILFGLYYSKSTEFWEVFKAGLVLGGLISLFFGTIVYYNDMARFIKPLVILAEIIIVLLVTYRFIKKKKG
jgi:predicted signal transduction protein with EAL and GGDEF domain